MTTSDPTLLSVAQMSVAMMARRLSPVDVVDGFLRRIEIHEPRLKAFVAVHGDDARLAAEAADRAIRAVRSHTNTNARPPSASALSLKRRPELEMSLSSAATFTARESTRLPLR
jgi:hypothetical protein